MEREGKRIGGIAAGTGNQERDGLAAYGFFIPYRRKILQRDGRVIEAGGHRFNDQESRLHEVSKTRGVAAMVV
jgi:hypothetical protein